MSGSYEKRRGGSSDIDFGDVRAANGDMSVTELIADESADGNFAGLEKRDLAILIGARSVEGRGVPIFHGVRENLAGSVFGDRFEGELAAEDGGGLQRSDFNAGDVGFSVGGL